MFKLKGHYEDWSSAGQHLKYAVSASSSGDTVITYYLQGEPGWGSFHDGGAVDVQVKALVGYQYVTTDYRLYLVTTNFKELATSDWSSTQTVTVPKELANPLPPWRNEPSQQSSPDTNAPQTTMAPTATPIQSGSNLTLPPLDWIEICAFVVVALVCVFLVVVIFFMRRRMKVLELKQNGS